MFLKILQNLQERACIGVSFSLKRPRRRCFLMNFAKIFKKLFLQNTSGRLLLNEKKSKRSAIFVIFIKRRLDLVIFLSFYRSLFFTFATFDIHLLDNLRHLQHRQSKKNVLVSNENLTHPLFFIEYS